MVNANLVRCACAATPNGAARPQTSRKYGAFPQPHLWHAISKEITTPFSCIRARLLSDAQQETGRASSWFSPPILSPSAFVCTLVVAWIAARISHAVLIAVDAAARVERAC